MKKRIVLCADDYGQSESVSQAIIKLIQMGRLSATSCLVNLPLWEEHAKRLLPFHSQVDLGLHFNLTEGRPLSVEYCQKEGQNFFSLPQLLRKAFAGKLSRQAIEAECHAQLDKFQRVLGFLPNYVDGHQHVHQFPVIRDVIISVYKSRLQGIYLRLVYEQIFSRDWLNCVKKAIIFATGSFAFKRLLDSNKILYNQSFAGIYRFSQSKNYAKFFKVFLQASKDRGLIMCHPGFSDALSFIGEARFQEYQFLSGDQFLEECLREEVVLTRFNCFQREDFPHFFAP